MAKIRTTSAIVLGSVVSSRSPLLHRRSQPAGSRAPAASRSRTGGCPASARRSPRASSPGRLVARTRSLSILEVPSEVAEGLRPTRAGPAPRNCGAALTMARSDSHPAAGSSQGAPESASVSKRRHPLEPRGPPLRAICSSEGGVRSDGCVSSNSGARPSKTARLLLPQTSSAATSVKPGSSQGRPGPLLDAGDPGPR